MAASAKPSRENPNTRLTLDFGSGCSPKACGGKSSEKKVNSGSSGLELSLSEAGKSKADRPNLAKRLGRTRFEFQESIREVIHFGV